MVWLILSVSSAFFLGVYEVTKKHALRDNAVWLVLLFGTFSSVIIFLPLIILSATGILTTENFFHVPVVNAREHFLIILKTVIVLTSWIFSYTSLKHLPITIASPIRATGPVWTLFGALIIYNEQINTVRWVGLMITLLFFFLFSTAGKKESISFKSNKWVWFAILGTIFSAASGLFDKFLIREIDRMSVQAYFSIYQVILLTPVVIIIRSTMKNPPKFTWRLSIPLIGVILVIADFLYFYALDYPDSLISVVSVVRRGSVIVSFLFGALLFKEKNIKHKAILLVGILAGIIILFLG